MATREATWAYRDDHDEFARTFYRRFGDGVVSSIGIGTYLGDPTDERDASYHDAIVTALESGINVVDTAINYRHRAPSVSSATPSRTPTWTVRQSLLRRKGGSSHLTGRARLTPARSSGRSTSTPARRPRRPRCRPALHCARLHADRSTGR